MQETRVQSLRQEDPLKEETATHSRILAGRIPRTEEPGGLQPTGSQRVGHDQVTELNSKEGSWEPQTRQLLSRKLWRPLD